MTSAFSWQNCYSLPCFIFNSKAKLALLQLSLDFLLLLYRTSDEKDFFFLVLILEGFVVLHRTFRLELLHIRGWSINLDYCDVEVEVNRDHSIIFEIVPRYCISDSFVDYEGYSISSKAFLPTVVVTM